MNIKYERLLQDVTYVISCKCKIVSVVVLSIHGNETVFFFLGTFSK